MIAVLDASAAIEIVLQRPGSTKLQEHVVRVDWLIAPTLFIAETFSRKTVHAPYSLTYTNLSDYPSSPNA